MARYGDLARLLNLPLKTVLMSDIIYGESAEMPNKISSVASLGLVVGGVLASLAPWGGEGGIATPNTADIAASERVVTPAGGHVTPVAFPLAPTRIMVTPAHRHATNATRPKSASMFSPISGAHAAAVGAKLTEWEVGPELRHPLAWHEGSRSLYFVRSYSEPRLIVRLDPATGTLTEWPVPGDGLFRIRVDPATGTVFFSDFVRTIRRLDPATNEVTEWVFPVTEHDPDGEIHTSGMDVDSAGNLWVMGYHNHTVYRLSLANNVLTAYPIPHDDPQNPDILVDADDNVFWQAQETNTMNVLFPKTNLYKEWPLPSFRRHLFGLGTGNPASPNLGKAHEIIFGLPAVNKVVRLNTETNVLTEWSEWDVHHNQNFDQSYVAVGRDKNRIYLTDSETGRVGMINSRTGRFLEWALPEDVQRGPTSLVIDQQNRLFFTSEVASRIGMLELPETIGQEAGE